MPSSPESTLDELLAALAAEATDITTSRDGEYTRNGMAFAARPEPNAIELRLGPEIADAALRTPQTRPSSRGEDWIRVETTSWATARDRVEAWFRVAWRLAGKSGRRRQG